MNRTDTATYYAPPAPDDASVARVKAPTFSIVIPCYQAADTVGEAVESVLGQTTAAHEVIVVDDGSTDDVDGALSPYQDSIVMLRQENRGVAAARNLGLRHATGEFMGVCDADDVYLPDALSELGALAQARPDLDILCCDGLLEFEGRILGRGRPDPTTFEIHNQRIGILRSNFVPGRSAFRRRRFLDVGGYDEALGCSEDWDCWIRLILDGARAGLVHTPLACTRIHSGSLTSSRVRLLRDQRVTLRKALTRTDLAPGERAVATRHEGELGRALALAELQEALLAGDRRVRRRCWAIATGRGYGARSRLKVAAAAVAPGSAAKWARRQMVGAEDFGYRPGHSLAR